MMRDRKQLYSSLLLLLIAVVSIIGATTAWLSIAKNTKVRSMDIDIATGPSLKIDLDAHSTIDEYVKTLTFDQISARIKSTQGFDPRTTSMEPVTTSDLKTFTFEKGKAADAKKGQYLEFTLHFMASDDMYVHLTTESARGEEDGTLVTSDNKNVTDSLRIGFTTDGTNWVYDPGAAEYANVSGSTRTYGLPDADHMVLSDHNKMFFLKANEDKAVTMHIWLEGTDPECTDAIADAKLQIQLRFIGTDENNVILEKTSDN